MHRRLYTSFNVYRRRVGARGFRKCKMSCEDVAVGDFDDGEGVGSAVTVASRNSVKAWRVA